MTLDLQTIVLAAISAGGLAQLVLFLNQRRRDKNDQEKTMIDEAQEQTYFVIQQLKKDLEDVKTEISELRLEMKQLQKEKMELEKENIVLKEKLKTSLEYQENLKSKLELLKQEVKMLKDQKLTILENIKGDV